jgi:flagellar protein FlbD
MISLHRLGQRDDTFHLNPDLIVTVEGNPDTVITLATGNRIVVAETPQEVAERIRDYRVDVMSRATGRPSQHRHAQRADLHAVREHEFQPL